MYISSLSTTLIDNTLCIIGVLTKPDRIQAGEAGSWTSFVKNEREALEHNWFCVKQPSPEQLKLGITWVEARNSENVWFSTTAPWCELEGRYQKYLRTSNLVAKLSIVLSDLIAKRSVSTSFAARWCFTEASFLTDCIKSTTSWRDQSLSVAQCWHSCHLGHLTHGAR